MEPRVPLFILNGCIGDQRLVVRAVDSDPIRILLHAPSRLVRARVLEPAGNDAASQELIGVDRDAVLMKAIGRRGGRQFPRDVGPLVVLEDDDRLLVDDEVFPEDVDLRIVRIEMPSATAFRLGL